MIKGLVFNQAFWIQKTDDVANKLNNYDNLKSFHDRAINQGSLVIECHLSEHDYWEYNGIYYKGNPEVYVNNDGTIGIRGSK